MDSKFNIEKLKNGDEINSVLDEFEDCSVYQTPAYATVNAAKNQYDCVVLKKGVKVLSFAIVRIIKIPFLNIKIAYIMRGPVWKRKGNPIDLTIFNQMLNGLVNIYAKQGFILRVTPFVFANDSAGSEIIDLFKANGFVRSNVSWRTILLDLSPSIDELQKGLRKRWRQTLNNAKKKGVEWMLHDTNCAITDVLSIYDEMHDRKKFAEFVDVHKYKKINQLLPENHKLRSIICMHENSIVSGIVWSKLGSIGLPLIAATSSKALKINAAYVMFWNMIETMKNEGLKNCDLGGVNKARNPGGYLFKTGMAERYGTETDYIGIFDFAQNKLLLMVIKLIETIRKTKHRFLIFLESTKKAPLKSK